MRKWEQEVPQSLRAQNYQDRNLLSWGQSSTYVNRHQLVVLGEIPILNGVSFGYSNLLTEPSVIKKSPRNFNWNSNLGRLKTALVPTINSKNHSSCVQSFKTNLTTLPKLSPDFYLKTKHSKCKKINFCKY